MTRPKFYTPAEAVEKIEEIHGRKINVNRLAQLRRAGKIHATTMGYNTTVYTLDDIKKADLSLSKAGRKPESEKKRQPRPRSPKQKESEAVELINVA